MMLNSAWTIDRANRIAQSIGSNSPTAAINAAYEKILGRMPTDNELQACRELLQDEATDLATELADLCHVLINCNEFVYVD